MIKNYVPSRIRKSVEFHIVFDDGDGTAGFCFYCNQKGELKDMPVEAEENYRWCMNHPEKFSRWNEIERTKNEYMEPGHGTCICGTEIELHDEYCGACQCPECGQWYNLFGQSLIPPEYWVRDAAQEEYW